MADLISALRDKYSEANLMNMLDPANASGWEAEGKRLAVNLPEVTVRDAAKFVAEMTPILGDAIAAKELWDMATSDNPNWPLIGAMGGATVIGLIPGIGDAAAKGIKAGARKMLDTAKRVEVDPNAMGSMLGNVRLKPNGDFDVTRKDASGTFGEGSERVRYTDPKSKSTIEIVVRPDGSASVLELVVPEGSRGKGLGQILQAQVMQDFPMMGGQVSSKAAATTAYRLGRRPVGQPDATINDVFAAIDDMSSVNLVSPDMQKKLAPSPAQEISGLLASGRADEVTDEMLGKLTPNDNMELFELYQSGATGMDLPMDEASRMARAESMFPRSGYHGTNADIKGFQGNVFSSDNPTLASTYARGSADAQIYPLRLGSKLGDTVVEGGGVNWNQLNPDEIYKTDPAVAEWLGYDELSDGSGRVSTRGVERAAMREGRSGVQFKDINDIGPGFNSNQFKNLGYTEGQERALQRQYMEDLSEPSNVDVRLSPNLVRSKFARFDPRLSNLKNLLAGLGVAPLSLMALLSENERNKDGLNY